MASSVEIAKDRSFRMLDAIIDSLTDEEIDELNADEGGDEESMPFEEFCRKEGIKLQK